MYQNSGSHDRGRNRLSSEAHLLSSRFPHCRPSARSQSEPARREIAMGSDAAGQRRGTIRVGPFVAAVRLLWGAWKARCEAVVSWHRVIEHAGSRQWNTGVTPPTSAVAAAPGPDTLPFCASRHRYYTMDDWERQGGWARSRGLSTLRQAPRLARGTLPGASWFG